MTNKSKRHTSNDVKETVATIATPDVPETEVIAPTEEVASEEEVAPVKQYSLDTDINFKDKESQEIKYAVNIKYSMPVIKVSATGTIRTEYKIFIDSIFFGRFAKYNWPKIFLKAKSQKEFQFKDWIELKRFVYQRAAEFWAAKADLMETDYKDLIQEYGMEESDNQEEKAKPIIKAAEKTQMTFDI